MLTNIRRVKETLLAPCNDRSKCVNMKGFLKGYGDIWVCKEFIANLLSLSNVADREGYRVCFDNRHGNEFVVEKPTGTIRFSPSNMDCTSTL